MSESEIFLSHHIRPTAVRQLVWREILHIDNAFSLADVEDLLPNMDRSSIFRTLSLFEEHGLLHGFEDGSGHRKYCLCMEHDEAEGHHHHHCHHVHAFCTVCHRTFCLKEEHIPTVQLPEGFTPQHINYVVQGVCEECGKKSTSY
ncbi:MAG: transcriptional repressor [Bacteroidaceae bacterium]|nr:transcriptional repressor [Bacteroidaceae bacterium]